MSDPNTFRLAPEARKFIAWYTVAMLMAIWLAS